MTVVKHKSGSILTHCVRTLAPPDSSELVLWVSVGFLPRVHLSTWLSGGVGAHYFPAVMPLLLPPQGSSLCCAVSVLPVILVSSLAPFAGKCLSVCCPLFTLLKMKSHVLFIYFEFTKPKVLEKFKIQKCFSLCWGVSVCVCVYTCACLR